MTDQSHQCPAAVRCQWCSSGAAHSSMQWVRVQVTRRTSAGTWQCVVPCVDHGHSVSAAGSVVMVELSDEMSVHNKSDGSAVNESTMTPCSFASSRLISQTSFQSAVRKSATARRVINRGRGTTSADWTRSRGPGTTTSARQSLLGRPVNARLSRRDARYRRCQVTVYNFLERPKKWRSVLYHLFVWVLHSLCCCSV